MVVEGVFQQEYSHKTVQVAYCVLAFTGHVTKDATIKKMEETMFLEMEGG